MSPEASERPELELRARVGGACPFCREPVGGLGEGAGSVSCPGCAATYHVACLGELEGCATLGCAARPDPVRTLAAPVRDEQARHSAPAPGVFRPQPQATGRSRRRGRGGQVFLPLLLLLPLVVAGGLPQSIAVPLGFALLMGAVVLRLRSLRS